MKHCRMPYKNIETAAYVTAINILAVEYLIKQNDRKEYTRRVEQVLSLSEIDLEIFFSLLCLSTPSWLWIIIAIYAKFKE